MDVNGAGRARPAGLGAAGSRPGRLALRLAAGALLAAPLAAVVAPPGSAGGGWEPPPKTIVKVRGTAAGGFTVRYYDGTAAYPPTLSEAMAECEEYAAEVERVRCRTAVRVGYRYLGRIKRSLRWAKESG